MRAVKRTFEIFILVITYSYVKHAIKVRFIKMFQMSDKTNKKVCDLNNSSMPLNDSYKSKSWKTVKLPMATRLSLVDEVVDLSGNIVLKIRGGIANGHSPYMKIASKVEVDFIDPQSDRILFHISRDFRGLNDMFTAVPFLRYDIGLIDNNKVRHTMELRQGIFGKSYNFRKFNFRKFNVQKGNNYYEVFMRCKNPSVATSLICCSEDPSICGNLVFKFYSVGKLFQKKELLMVRNLYEETVEYGPSLTLEEAVFVGYAIDWLTFPMEDPITKEAFGR